MRRGISRFPKAYDRISGRTLWGAILSHAYGLVQFYRLPRLPAGFKNTLSQASRQPGDAGRPPLKEIL
jgi:hypothetical protein